MKIGTRVYNRGDMANLEHWGTITKIIPNKMFYEEVEITPDPDADRGPYRVPTAMISNVDKGNGLTRIVTEEAYNKRYEAQMQKLRDLHNRLMSAKQTSN